MDFMVQVLLMFNKSGYPLGLQPTCSPCMSLTGGFTLNLMWAS
jgi:hypothetical protein